MALFRLVWDRIAFAHTDLMWRRASATMIDIWLVDILTTLARSLVRDQSFSHEFLLKQEFTVEFIFLRLLLTYVSYIISMAILESLFGRTPGKFIRRLRVNRFGGGKLSLIEALKRNTLKFVDILLLWGLIFTCDPSREGKGLGDRWACSVVVRT